MTPAPPGALRVLITTKIFPNRSAPGWAPFNRQQFAALARLPGVQVTDVLATIPWFPGVGLLGRRSLAAGLVKVPAQDTIDGLSVRHPRTLYLPRIGHGLAGGLHAASLLPHMLRYRGRVDVILAAWAYPDGCAAVALGALLGVPVVVKLHGSDVNVLSKKAGPRAMMRLFLPRAARVVSVSEALRQEVIGLGVAPGRVEVVRNGVNGALFHPRPKEQVRADLGLPEGPLLCCVSRMERDKGVLDLLEAFASARQHQHLTGARLVLCGGGAALKECEARAAQPDLAGAVRLLGPVPLSEVPRWMCAADVVVMPSWAEGLPNTVLEALACGRRVVATDVGGVSEVITSTALGHLCPPRDPRALGEAIVAAFAAPAAPPGPAAGPGTSPVGDWAESAAALLGALRKAVAAG